jgi:hypothetical protein
LVNLDGSDRPVTQAFAAFAEKIRPHTGALMECRPPQAKVGIWRSRKNEIFHFAMLGEFSALAEDLEGYIQALYWNNLPYRTVCSEELAAGELEGLTLLVLPAPYCLTEPEARSLDGWVRRGGVVVSEAHLAGYNGTTGRHSRTLPGCGLAEAWELRETDSTSSYHLSTGPLSDPGDALQSQVMPEDVRKVLADLRVAGGQYFPIQLASGKYAWGAARYARLVGSELREEGRFEMDTPCLVSKEVGAGAVFYAATNLGQGARKDPSGLLSWLQKAADRAGIHPAAGISGPGQGQVRVDLLSDSYAARFLVIHNHSKDEQEIKLEPLPDGRGLFSGALLALSAGETLRIPGGFIDLVVLASS